MAHPDMSGDQSSRIVDSASPEQIAEGDTGAKLAEVRATIQLSVGQIVLLMFNLPRYRYQTLDDLNHIVLEPLLRDRIAIARSQRDDQNDSKALVGVAIWAKVDEAVDAKLTEQVRAGVFPMRLKPEDWASGDTVWLLDVIAPDRKLATAVLANFRQIAGDRPVKIHPVVARSVEPGLLEKLHARPAGAVGPAAEPVTAGA